MATGIVTLTAALRDLGAIGQDEQPDVEQRKIGLEALIALLDRLVDGYCLDGLYQQSANADVTIGGNVSLRLTTGTGIDVTLPDLPNDGWRARIVNASGASATVKPNGHLIGATVSAANGSDVTLATGASLDRFFRRDVGAWISPTITKLSDALPYPSNFDDGFVAMLAILVAPKFEMTAQVTPLMAALAKATQDALDKRYGARRLAAG